MPPNPWTQSKLYISPYTRQVKCKVLLPKEFQTPSLPSGLVGDYTTFSANRQTLSFNGVFPLLNGDRDEVTGRVPLPEEEGQVQSRWR